jgi:hypothetical protein
VDFDQLEEVLVTRGPVNPTDPMVTAAGVGTCAASCVGDHRRGRDAAPDERLAARALSSGRARSDPRADSLRRHPHPSASGACGAFVLGYFSTRSPGTILGMHAFALTAVFAGVHIIGRNFWMESGAPVMIWSSPAPARAAGERRDRNARGVPVARLAACAPLRSAGSRHGSARLPHRVRLRSLGEAACSA